MSADIKIFKLNEYDYYAGRTMRECADQLRKDNDVDDDEYFDEEEACELSEEELNEMMISDEDDSTGDLHSFRAALDIMIKSGTKFPCIFVQTE